ncbi:MAG TPA: hypothetical protein VM619_04095 [Luteimonas sp.]|nr:hypothetical protein [Luteimonas sp.]
MNEDVKLSPASQAALDDGLLEANRWSGNAPESLDKRYLMGGRLAIQKSSTLGPPGAEPYFSAAAADPAQVADLEREVARMRAELAEVIRYDAQTGEPVYRYQGDARTTREKALYFKEAVQLPGVRKMVAAAAQWRADHVPTELEKLDAERQHKARVEARAQELVLEDDARALAERMKAQRRSAG